MFQQIQHYHNTKIVIKNAPWRVSNKTLHQDLEHLSSRLSFMSEVINVMIQYMITTATGPTSIRQFSPP